MSNSLRIDDDLRALKRGELDLDTLIGRFQAFLTGSDESADSLIDQLEAARDNRDIEEQDFTRLRDFVNDTRTSSSHVGVRGDSEFTVLATQAEAVSLPKDAVPLSPGLHLRDRFILDEVIGVGGMGIVYRGRDLLKLEAKDRNPFVAIKVLNESFKTRPESFIALQREASRQQRLAHPNIATVHDFDRAEEIIFITMEYLDGRTLDDFIKQKVKPAGKLSMTEAAPIIDQLCAALIYAHEHKIVHADFKPGNCFITENEQVKVLDFGIARAVKDPEVQGGDETLFDARSIGAMTPAYASPEMLDNSAEADPRDDIYALGCVTYELLTGSHPFLRVPANRAQEQGMQPRRIKRLSRRQNEALARALAFDREARTPTVAEFRRGLLQAPRNRFNWKWLSAAAVVIAMVVAAAMLPEYLDRQEAQAVLALVTSDAPADTAEGLARLPDLTQTQRARVLQEGRSAIIGFYEGALQDGLAQPNMQVPYPQLAELLAAAAEYYPDSAKLGRLRADYTQDRERHLAMLSTSFDRLLAPERLLSDPNDFDLQDLLSRLQQIDPGNPLLADSRIPGAFAAAVEQSIAAGDYSRAQAFLDSGRQLRPADPKLTDLNDTLASIRVEQARLAQIANLEAQIKGLSEDAQSLADATTLAEAVAGLQELDPQNAVAVAAGPAFAEQVRDEVNALLEIAEIKPVEQLVETYKVPLRRLGQAQILESLEQHRETLAGRQIALQAELRGLLEADSFANAEVVRFAAALESLREIDPADPAVDDLLRDLTTGQLDRARSLARQEQWSAAQNQLQLATGLDLPAAQLQALEQEKQALLFQEQQLLSERAEAARLERLRIAREQELRERQLAESERAAQLQRQAEAEAAAREKRLEAERLAARREEQRLAAIAAAVTAAQSAVSELEGTPAALDRANKAIIGLAEVAPEHVELVGLRGLLEERLQQQASDLVTSGDLQAAQRLIAHAEAKVSPQPDLSAATQALSSAREAAQMAQRQRDIDRAEQDLQALLVDRETLFTVRGARAATEALASLGAVAGKDAEVYIAGQDRFLTLQLEEARSLVSQKRFTRAGQLLENAAAVANTDAVQAAQAELAQARDQFRQQRAAQERASRVEALQQRIELQINADQLDEAIASLRTLEQLDADNVYANDSVPAKLAEAYAGRAALLVSQAKLDAAASALASARNWQPDSQRVAELLQVLALERSVQSISAWFAGSAAAGALPDIRRQVQQIQNENSDRHEQLLPQWEQAALDRLRQLRDERTAHNDYLSRVQQVLPGAARLSSMALIPEPVAEPVQPAMTAQLAVSDLLGKWCSDGVDLVFQQNKLVFIVGRQQVDYPLSAYRLEGDRIAVHWRDQRQGSMVNEFGSFDEQRESMVQLRGRREKDSRWQSYNRSFKRCS